MQSLISRVEAYAKELEKEEGPITSWRFSTSTNKFEFFKGEAELVDSISLEEVEELPTI